MNTNRIWAIGTVIAIAAVVGLGWLLGVSPLLAATGDADNQRVGIEQANQAQEVVLAQMKSDHDRIDELKDELDQQKLSIPNEVDSDFMYLYFASLQGAIGVPIQGIVTGEAQIYGATVDESAPVDPNAAPAAGAIADLYTVPITVNFTKEASFEQVMAFAGALQNGPRLFLVTSIARTDGSVDEGMATITGFMFVLSDPDDSPGSSAGESATQLTGATFTPIKPWGWQTSEAATTPAPSGTPTPTATETPGP